MKRLLTQEVAMAIQKGDVNYAAILQGMDLTRSMGDDFVRPVELSINEKLGQEFRIKRLRDAA